MPDSNDYARKTIFYNNSDDVELKISFDRLKDYYQNKDYRHYFINSENSMDKANQELLKELILKLLKLILKRY